MQFRKIITNPTKNGKKCGKLYNIESCSGTCSQTDPKIPDNYADWKNGGGDDGGGDDDNGDNGGSTAGYV